MATSYTSSGAAIQGTSTGIGSGVAGFSDDASNKPVHYLCGDCDNKVTLKRGDPIRCKECGYRVLYKQRTNRYAPYISCSFWSLGSACLGRLVVSAQEKENKSNTTSLVAQNDPV